MTRVNDRGGDARVDAAIAHVARVHAPPGLRLRVEAAVAGSPAPVRAGTFLTARVALAATVLLVAALGLWWRSTDAGRLPSHQLAGGHQHEAPVPQPASDVPGRALAMPTREEPARFVRQAQVATATAGSLPPWGRPAAAPVAGDESDGSLPPLEPPAALHVAPLGATPLIVAELAEPASMAPPPLDLFDEPPPDDRGAGESRW